MPWVCAHAAVWFHAWVKLWISCFWTTAQPVCEVPEEVAVEVDPAPPLAAWPGAWSPALDEVPGHGGSRDPIVVGVPPAEVRQARPHRERWVETRHG